MRHAPYASIWKSLSQFPTGKRYTRVNQIGQATLMTDLGEAPVPFDFDAVFESDYRRVVRMVARIIRDHGRAEDLAVEAFWRLWNQPRAHGPSAKAWLHRTAVRLALDELRRHARRLRYETLGNLIGLPRIPDELFASSQEQGRVRTILAVIPARQAELLLLRADGWSYDELAEVLGLNPSSVGTLLRRARAKFRKVYVNHYGEQY